MKSLNRRGTFAFLITCLFIIAWCGTPAQRVYADKPQGDTATKSAEVKPAVDASKGNSTSAMKSMSKMKFPAAKDMKFKDDIETNAPLPKKVTDLVFTGKNGEEIKLGDFIGKKNIVLVFTEGFDGMLCPFCKAQTSRLVANYERFTKRDCEVIVVFPGPADHLEEFIQAATNTEKEQVDQVPFPIVLDKEFTATNYFDIHSKHAHPSTYIIDKQGGVQFAYVGKDMSADRPSIAAMLKKLDKIEGK